MSAVEYSTSDLRKPQSVAEADRACKSLHYAFSADTGKFGNLALIDSQTAIYTIGNAVVLENVFDQHKEYIMGIDEGGVGCVCVHPSKKMFAVGGRGHKPSIYIYSYPEKKILKVLKGEAERGYASMDFNHAGTKLASVATAPDYMLTVWDWEEERVMLHTKAFGQDVFSVSFSVDDDNRLVTSGTGHIRFWKIASTFTGLKLQGQIGKFGKVDLSDISSFVELPDGKVVSASETGSLLLWEGGFIKCRLTRTGGGLCHAGDINYCYLDRKERVVITGGVDGYLRFWPFDDIDVAEVDTDITMDYEVEPVCELFLGEGCGVRTMVDSGPLPNDANKRFMVVVDGLGNQRLLDMDLTASEGLLVGAIQAARGEDGAGDVLGALGDKVLNNNHAGSATAIDACPLSHLAVSCGADGAVRVWDYIKRSAVCSRTFDAPVCSLKWCPRHMDSSGRTFVAGYANGMLRTLSLGRGTDEAGSASVSLKHTTKAHNGAVQSIAFTGDGKKMATAGGDGFVWIMDTTNLGTKGLLAPLRFFVPRPASEESVRLSGTLFTATCTHVAWSESERELVCTCSDGSLVFADVSPIVEGTLDNDVESFRVDVPLTTRSLTGQVATVVEVESPTKASAADAETEGESPETEGGVDAEPSVASVAPIAEVVYESMAAKVDCAVPFVNGSMANGLLVGANLGATAQLMELKNNTETEGITLRTGLHSTDGKEYIKAPGVTAIRYSQTRKFVASAGRDGTVTVRAVDYPAAFLSFPAHSGATTDVAFSFDDNFVLSTSADGSLVVHAFRHELFMQQVPGMEADLDAGVFDNILVKPKNDHVKDDSPEYLDSVTDTAKAEHVASQDGLTFVTVADAATEVVEVDPTSYSLEDAKLKAAEDDRRMTADDKKEIMRGKIRGLQASFAALRTQNAELPEQARLNETDLVVDPVVVDIFTREGEATIKEVHSVCAYESERASALLRKVQMRLMTGLLVEEMPLKTFPSLKKGDSRSVTCVKSFRTKAMNSALLETLESVRNAVKKEASAVAKAAATLAAQQAAEKDVEAVQGKIQQNLVSHQAEGSGAGGEGAGGEQAYTAGARRDARKARKENLRAHCKEKPSENEDDLRDVHAIAEAQETVGDFKLKGADDYKVPADQRVNAEKKRRQLVMLEESTISLRLQFNERFLALRYLKRQMVGVISADADRLRAIDTALGDASQEVWVPSVDAEEYPDDRDEVDAQELAAYTKLRETDPWLGTLAPENKLTTGTKTKVAVDITTGAYDIIKNGEAITNVKVHDTHGNLDKDKYRAEVSEEAVGVGEYGVDTRVLGSFYGSPKQDADLKLLEQQMPTLRAARLAMARAATPQSQVAEAQRAGLETRSRLARERAQLVTKTEETVEMFSQAVEQLRRDRHVTATRLVLAELRVLVMLQEFQLLQTFEEKDNMLHQKQVRCLREKNEISSGSAQLQEVMGSKTTEISEWKDKHVAIFSEFEECVPDSSPFIDVLTKIFKRKIKRRKMTEGEDEESEEETDDDDEDEDEDEEDDEEFEEACPPGCDASMYDKVIDLREKRLNIDEFISDNQKVVDDNKKAHDRLKTREKQIDKDLKNTEAEIHQFQLTKQAALNTVEIIVPLRAAQVFAFDNSGMLTGPEKPEKKGGDDNQDGEDPARALEEAAIRDLADVHGRSLINAVDINSHVVFSSVALERLQGRIGELQQEYEAARVDFKQLHRERASLERQVKAGKVKIEDWTAKCTDLQMLKFGKLIDLDELEAGSDTTRIDEAEAQCIGVEKRFQSSSARLVRQQEQLQDKLSEVTIANTTLLAQISSLTEKKLTLNRSLNHPGQAMSGDMKLAFMKEIEEKKSIKSYIQVQARELDALRQELAMLRRKDNLTGPVMPSPPQSMQLPPIAPKGV